MPLPSPSTRSLTRRQLLRALAAGVSVPAIAALAGCSEERSGALGGPRERDGEVTELVVPTNRSPWLDAYKRVAAMYEQDRGVKITLREFPYDGLRTQQANAVQGGGFPFDVFQLDEPWTGQFYDRGWVSPLTEIDDGFRLDPEVLTYDSLPLWDPDQRTSAQGGQVMGLPLNGNVHLLVYRTDLYEQLGLSVPRTWEEAVAGGRAARRSGRVEFGYVPRAQASLGGQAITYEFMPVFYSYGANWFADEGRDWTPAVNTPEAAEAAAVFRELAALGPAETQTIGQAEVIALMQGGQALQTHVVAAAAAQFLDPAASQVADRVAFAVVPAGPTGTPTPTSGTWSLCIPAGLPRERAAAAMDFISWMLERQTQLTFTQEGGIPTRRDTYQAGDLPESAGAYLPAVAESMPGVRRAVRYVFATPMLEATERILSEIAAGAQPAQAGLDTLQRELTQVVRDAGFLG